MSGAVQAFYEAAYRGPSLKSPLRSAPQTTSNTSPGAVKADLALTRSGLGRRERIPTTGGRSLFCVRKDLMGTPLNAPAAGLPSPGAGGCRWAGTCAAFQSLGREVLTPRGGWRKSPCEEKANQAAGGISWVQLLGASKEGCPSLTPPALSSSPPPSTSREGPQKPVQESLKQKGRSQV